MHPYSKPFVVTKPGISFAFDLGVDCPRSTPSRLGDVVFIDPSNEHAKNAIASGCLAECHIEDGKVVPGAGKDELSSVPRSSANAVGPDFYSMTVAELRAEAKAMGVKIPLDIRNKADIAGFLSEQ